MVTSKLFREGRKDTKVITQPLTQCTRTNKCFDMNGIFIFLLMTLHDVISKKEITK